MLILVASMVVSCVMLHLSFTFSNVSGVTLLLEMMHWVYAGKCGWDFVCYL